MRYVEHAGVPAGGAPMSVLGFGCSALLGRASRAESEGAVAAALDLGITFFDTARSYGYGRSETLLGELLEGRRQQMFLCTKFGILPAEGGWKQRVKPLARAVVKAFPGLRQAARRQAASEFTKGQFSVEVLRTSFEASLRELKTDYVDMLLMHAAPASVLAQDDLLEALARLVASGKVRMAGISGELPVMAEYFKRRPEPLKTAQFALNPAHFGFVSETRKASDLLLVANHPYGGPGGKAGDLVAGLAADAKLPKELREKLAAGDAQVLPEVVLGGILAGTGVNAVVPAMMQVRHIESNVRALEECRFSGEELGILRERLVARG